MKIIKEIRKILSDIHPECKVEGHRVHTTLFVNDEKWPEWGNFIYGIAGGLVHFEHIPDKDAWVARQKEIEAEIGKPEKMDGLHIIEDGIHGRCVNECGPIGFFYKSVA